MSLDINHEITATSAEGVATTSGGAHTLVRLNLKEAALRHTGTADEFLATTLLRVIGYAHDEDILKLFYDIQDLKLKEGLPDEELASKILFKDILDGELIVARAETDVHHA